MHPAIAAWAGHDTQRQMGLRGSELCGAHFHPGPPPQGALDSGSTIVPVRSALVPDSQGFFGTSATQGRTSRPAITSCVSPCPNPTQPLPPVESSPHNMASTSISDAGARHDSDSHLSCIPSTTNRQNNVPHLLPGTIVCRRTKPCCYVLLMLLERGVGRMNKRAMRSRGSQSCCTTPLTRGVERTCVMQWYSEPRSEGS